MNKYQLIKELQTFPKYQSCSYYSLDKYNKEYLKNLLENLRNDLIQRENQIPNRQHNSRFTKPELVERLLSTDEYKRNQLSFNQLFREYKSDLLSRMDRLNIRM